MAGIQAVLVTPLSGPLSGFGRAGATALDLWARQFATPDTVSLEFVDAHPNPRDAVARAEALAPDLLFGPYGSGPAADVAAATRRLVWNHGGARVPPRDNLVSVLAAADTYFTGAIEFVHHTFPRARTIGMLHGGTGFARAVAAGAARAAHHHGFGTRFALLPAEPPHADVLLVAGRFDEELAVARGLDRTRWRAVGLVAAGVREVLGQLGDDAREGLLGPAQWMPEAAPEPDEGPPVARFVAAYRGRTGDDPPYPAAQAFAAGLIALRCLRESASADDAGLLAAARRLECTTLFGPFSIDSFGRQVAHRVLTVQWRHGQRAVVWPPERASGVPR
jgi:hypothetical protein